MVIRPFASSTSFRLSLAAYRVVFGQPRQEELVTLLDRAGVDVGRLRDWAVDLSPPATPKFRSWCSEHDSHS